MYFLKKILLTGFLFVSQMSYGGGWTSGGGELIRDAHNPWFLSNTKEVRYCIQINEKDFGQSKEFVRLQIAKAWDFWKIQLQELNYIKLGGTDFDFTLGTQNLKEVACSENVDLKFQFAYLDQEQKEKMGDLSKTIAVSVRTDYDAKNLKGKGFIYFNKNEQFPEMPWTRTEGSRVLLVAIHELGHIFGIQHEEDIAFMQETYPETLIDPKQFAVTDSVTLYFNQGDNYKKEHLFTYQPNWLFLSGCMVNIPKPKTIHNLNKSKYIVKEFFGQAPDDYCDGHFVDGNVFKFQSGKDILTTIGEAQLKRQLDSDYDRKYFISFWFPPEQVVLNIGPYYISNKTFIANFQPKQFFKGIYKTLDGKISRPIAVEVFNNGFVSRVSGEMNGELYLNIFQGF